MVNLRERLQQAVRSLITRATQLGDAYRNGVHVFISQLHGAAQIDELEHIEPFGYASRPADGSEHIVLALGGKRRKSVVIMAHNRAFKFSLNPGETSIYNQFGDHVHLKDNGEMHVKSSAKVYAETPLFECSADCLVQGNLTVMGTSVMQSNVSILGGGLTCAVPAAFTAAVGFAATVTHNGVSIGTDHDHYAGTETDGSTGTVR